MGDGRSLQELEQDPPAVHYDDEELPARELAGPVGLGVAIVAFAVAVLVLWQVFRPLAQGSQFYLIVFLAGTLPLVFLAYRSGFGRRGAEPAEVRRAEAGRAEAGRPAVLDWVLAAGTLL